MLASSRSLLRRCWWFVSCLGFLSLPAAAQEPSPEPPPAASPRFGLGVRVAHGFPGDISSEETGLPRDLQGLVIAPQVDVSWFYSPHLSFGLHGQYGVGRYSRYCGDESCRGGVLRVGLGLQYQFTPERVWSAWVGAGVGYERHMMKERNLDQWGESRSSVWSGFELARAEVGVDLKLSEHFRVGPYVTGSAGTYLWRSTRAAPYMDRTESLDFALHFWVMPGVRLQARL
ncbi:hypothetical protein ACN47A_08595 [Myxococcus fulvus]|uniref:hypothetical protein n=1 Tax=Myxococcus fulvus TaxID=33 RepID=UPI003B9C25AC